MIVNRERERAFESTVNYLHEAGQQGEFVDLADQQQASCA